jgi:hypothetical protein
MVSTSAWPHCGHVMRVMPVTLSGSISNSVRQSIPTAADISRTEPLVRLILNQIGRRLCDSDLIDPEELALETLPTLPDDHQLGAWAAIHFPDHTPSGRPIARGPVVTTIRECLAVVESGEAVVIVGERLERYYSNPAIRYIEIDVPPVGTAFVRRRADRRRAIQDLEECSRDVAAGLVDVAGQ